MPQEIQMFLLMFLIGTWHPGFLVIIDEAHRGIPDEGSKIKNMPIHEGSKLESGLPNKLEASFIIISFHLEKYGKYPIRARKFWWCEGENSLNPYPYRTEKSRRNCGLREFIMHKDTVTFAYISMEEEIFKAWALEFGVANPDAIRKAHKTRREWKERAGVVIPSGPEISNAEYKTAQTMAGPEPWPDHSVLTVAQPPFGRSRSRSRSPSVPRPDTMSGVEIAAPREPDVLLEQLNVRCSRTLGVATEVDAALSERWEQKEDMKGFAQPDRKRDPAKHPVPSEKDRRIIFVPPGFHYVEMDPLELKEEGLQKEAAASSGRPSSGTSLEAARSVLREDCPKSIAGNPAAWKPLGKVCAGANCNKTMMDKAEWNRDHGRFYCHTCYDNLWNPKKPCEGCNKTMVDKTEWNKYDGRFYCHTCYDNLWNSKKQPCEGRNCNKTMDKTEWKKDHGRYYCHTCYDSLDWKNPKKRKLSDSAAAASSGAQGETEKSRN